MDKTAIGNAGETAVCRYLKFRGYEIIDRNYKTRFGEIDIIAKKKNIIAFIEVKTRQKNSLVSGLDAVGYKKQHRVITAAKEFILKKHLFDLQPRFDVAEVTDYRRKLARFSIKYIENAFSE